MDGEALYFQLVNRHQGFCMPVPEMRHKVVQLLFSSAVNHVNAILIQPRWRTHKELITQQVPE
jgi:hypothetical protein